MSAFLLIFCDHILSCEQEPNSKKFVKSVNKHYSGRKKEKKH